MNTVGLGNINKVSDVRFFGEKVNALPNRNRNETISTKPTFLENLKRYLKDYADVTGIQGLRYLSERNRSVVERIFWIVIMVVALYLCIVLIISTYVKWDNSPVLVSFATSQTPIWQIPFPAVTICPETKFRREIFNYTDVLIRIKRGQTTTEEELRNFDYASLVCSPFLKVNKKIFSKEVNDSALDFLSKASPGLQLSQIFWAGESYEAADDLFSPILTSEGICYTFNIQDRSEVFSDDVILYDDCFRTRGKMSSWAIDKGYPKDAGIADAYPKRTVLNGKSGGLEIVLHVQANDMDYGCANGVQGFKVTLHNPGEIPRVKQKYFRVPLGTSVVAGVIPNMMTTSEQLRPCPAEKRQCYFVGEKKLRLFKGYNQANCLIECLTDYTLACCGCVGFHMARTNGTAVCGAANQKCINDAKTKFLEAEIKFKMGNCEGNQDDVFSEQLEKCNCLPACNSLDFDEDISQSTWHYEEYVNVMKAAGEWDEADHHGPNDTKQYVSKLSVFFKEMQFITSQRNELYGKIAFLANVGGIIGLFTGCSFITFFEILYYMTLRIMCNLWNYGRHNWSATQDV